MPEEAKDKNVADESQLEGFDEEDISENELSSEIGYYGPTHDNVRRMIREAVIEYGEERLRRPIDDKCEKVLIALFQEAHDCAMNNVHTPTYEVTEQAAVKPIFTGGADKLLGEKMYRLTESQEFTQGLVHLLIKS